MHQLTAHETPARRRRVTIVSETQVYVRCDKRLKSKLHRQVRSVDRNASVVAIPLLGLHELAAAELACILLALRGVGCNRDLAASDDHWPSWETRVDRALGHEDLSLSDSSRLLGSLFRSLRRGRLLSNTLSLGVPFLLGTFFPLLQLSCLPILKAIHNACRSLGTEALPLFGQHVFVRELDMLNLSRMPRGTSHCSRLSHVVVIVITLWFWCSTRFGFLLGLAGEAIVQPERLKHGLVAGNVVEAVKLVLREHFFLRS